MQLNIKRAPGIGGARIARRLGSLAAVGVLGGCKVEAVRCTERNFQSRMTFGCSADRTDRHRMVAVVFSNLLKDELEVRQWRNARYFQEAGCRSPGRVGRAGMLARPGPALTGIKAMVRVGCLSRGDLVDGEGLGRRISDAIVSGARRRTEDPIPRSSLWPDCRSRWGRSRWRHGSRSSPLAWCRRCLSP